MRELLSGNEAVARGAYEAGVKVASAYPGTPSTEITENLAKYPEINAQWAPNEKAALETALGAAVYGARAVCAFKHVGLNVAADPLFTASYTGVGAGLLICVADDPGMHSSQNEQDSRNYAFAAKVLTLEPSDSAECLRFAKEALALSETFDTPVMLRLTTRVSHSKSITELGGRSEFSKPYVKNARKYVMVPKNARERHAALEEKILKLKEWAEATPLNAVENNNAKIGVITSGAAYLYAKEALGNAVSYFKLGVAYPLPEQKLRDFASLVETCIVIEELDPILENACRAMGLSVRGKEMFSLCGEYSPRIIAAAVLGEAFETPENAGVPPREPVMCPGCPHRPVFFALGKLKLTVAGDIGCYTLGAAPPLAAMDTCVCMGSGVTMAHGFDAAGGERIVSVIGDSTFIHSGVTGIVNAVYNKGKSTVIILDNATTAMTGHQDHPATGFTIKKEPTYKIDLEALCRAVGVSRVVTVDPYDLPRLTEAIAAETEADGLSVVIARRECALLAGKKGPGYKCDAQKCVMCSACLKVGCPALYKSGEKVSISGELCFGCGLCAALCAKGAIGVV